MHIQQNGKLIKQIGSKEKKTNIQTTSSDSQIWLAHILSAEQPTVRADSKHSSHGDWTMFCDKNIWNTAI